MSKHAGRSGRPWKRTRKAFRDQCAKINAPCHICNGKFGPIRYDMSDRSKWGFNADHVIPWSQIPEGDPRRSDVRNLRSAHFYCNTVKNDGRGDVQSRIHGGEGLPTFKPEGW